MSKPVTKMLVLKEMISLSKTLYCVEVTTFFVAGFIRLSGNKFRTINERTPLSKYKTTDFTIMTNQVQIIGSLKSKILKRRGTDHCEIKIV